MNCPARAREGALGYGELRAGSFSVEDRGQTMFTSSCINSNSFIIIAVLITLAVGDGISEDDNNVLGNLFTSLGSLFLTKAAQLASKQNQDDIRQKISDMENQLQSLKNKLK